MSEPAPPTPKKRKRPDCPVCRRYADRERDAKGRFYIKCHGCGYDSRYDNRNRYGTVP